MPGKYDNIINKERPEDSRHTPMSMHGRAAQFAPFDALTGFGGMIFEENRETAARPFPDIDARQEINDILCFLEENHNTETTVRVDYFEPDKTKDGGSVITVCGRPGKIDKYEKYLQLEGGEKIMLEDILKLELL